MPIEPDDIFGPGDEVPTGRIVDVTPRKKKEGFIDFESDQPILEQILEDHKLDRSDNRPDSKPSRFRQFIFYALLFMIVLSAFMVAYYIIIK